MSLYVSTLHFVLNLFLCIFYFLFIYQYLSTVFIYPSVFSNKMGYGTNNKL